MITELVAALVDADRAGIDGIDIAAAGADAHLAMRLAHRVRQRPEQLILLLDEMKRARAAPSVARAPAPLPEAG